MLQTPSTAQLSTTFGKSVARASAIELISPTEGSHPVNELVLPPFLSPGKQGPLGPRVTLARIIPCPANPLARCFTLARNASEGNR